MSTSTAPLWTPSEDSVERANVTAFLRWLGHEEWDYEALWRWSVEELDAFWEAVWRFYEVRSSTAYLAVLDGHAMPGARWFDGAHVNYAEHVLERAPESAPAI